MGIKAMSQSTPARQRASGWLFIVAALFFIGFGVTMTVEQAYALKFYRPTDATIVGGVVASKRGTRGGTTYRANIHYTYYAGGRLRHSNQVTAIDTDPGEDWAERTVANFPPGKATVAYVSTKDPDKVYLVKESFFVPYLFVLFPVGHLIAGLMTALDGSRYSVERLCLAVWMGVGLLAGVHYLWIATQFEWLAVITFAAYGFVGVLGFRDVARERRTHRLRPS